MCAFASLLVCFAWRYLASLGLRVVSYLCWRCLSLLALLSVACFLFGVILLRSARPPTHLHAAQFLRSAAYSRRNFLAAQFLFFLANRGGPRGGPRAPCKRPRAKGPKGPKGPLGPLGQGALRAPGPLRGPGGPLIRKKCYP